MLQKKYIWPIIYSILLFSFTIHILLDTFIIARVYTEVPSEESPSESEAYAPNNSAPTPTDTAPSLLTDKAEAPVITDNTYKDTEITISITEFREYNTVIYVADIQLSSADYLKTAFAMDSFGKNITEKTSDIAKNHNAILAINGDYYGVQESGYVLRNGTLYRSRSSQDQEDLVIFNNGSFLIITENDTSADDLLTAGAQQILSFGPALLINSSISVTQEEEVGKAKASNPRTAIGIIDKLHYLFVVSDGRTTESKGLTLYELAEFMQSLGASTAYNLDGGGSSTMYFNGKIINNPTTSGKSIKERSVSDIVYIGY